MKKRVQIKPFLLILLAFSLALSVFFPAAAAGGKQGGYSSQYNAVLSYLENGSAPAFGSIGGEWKVFALARSGRISPSGSYASAYYSRIEAMVADHGSAKLDNNRSTENSRLIIALTSIGRDARNVSGFDLTEPLSDFSFVKKQGINGAIYALLALDSSSAYGMSSVRQQCVSFILSREISGGGWSLTGMGNPDPDITAMVITALSRYSSASAAVNRGLDALSGIQNDDGGFSSMGTPCSESCAQVLTALSAMGINAASDSRFIKNGRSVVDALLGYFTGSGFAHTAGGGVNAMASEQAAYSLCAYDRMLHGRNALYNMNDVSFVNASPTPAPTASPTPKPTSTPAPTAAPTAVPTAAPTVEPTEAPVETPTAQITEALTESATEAVTPFEERTSEPTEALTEVPTEAAITPEPPDDIADAPRSRSWLVPAALGAALLLFVGGMLLTPRKKHR